MKISPHSIEFLNTHFLSSDEEDDVTGVKRYFNRIADQIGGAESPFVKELQDVFTEFKFLPSSQWLKWLGGRSLATTESLVWTPLEEINQGGLPTVSLADSQLLKLLENQDGFVAEVPAAFARALLHGETWRIHYREALNTSVEVASRTLWEGLARHMRASGHPRLLFPEAVSAENRLHPTTGPQVRGVVNLAAHIGQQNGMAFLDWKALEQTIGTGVRALDRMIDLLPDDSLFQELQESRRIGMGLIGWADALCQLGIPYEMPEAINLARRLAKFVKGAATGASVSLAEELGAEPGTRTQVRGFTETARNQIRTAILPDEELARIAGTTAGTEPLVGLSGTFNDGTGKLQLWFFNTLMAQLEARNLLSESILNELVDHGGFTEETELAEDFLDLFKTREQIPLNKQLQHQTAFGQFLDGPIGQRLWLKPEQGWEVIGDGLQTAIRLRHQILWVASPEDRDTFRPGNSH